MSSIPGIYPSTRNSSSLSQNQVPANPGPLDQAVTSIYERSVGSKLDWQFEQGQPPETAINNRKHNGG